MSEAPPLVAVGDNVAACGMVQMFD